MKVLLPAVQDAVAVATGPASEQVVAPVFTPDGSGVVFSSNRAGPARVGQLYVVELSGAESAVPRPLTFGPRSVVQASFSRDGLVLYAYVNDELPDLEYGDVVRYEWSTPDVR